MKAHRKLLREIDRGFDPGVQRAAAKVLVAFALVDAKSIQAFTELDKPTILDVLDRMESKGFMGSRVIWREACDKDDHFAAEVGLVLDVLTIADVLEREWDAEANDYKYRKIEYQEPPPLLEGQTYSARREGTVIINTATKEVVWPQKQLAPPQ